MRGLSLVTSFKLAPLPALPVRGDASFQTVLANASTEEEISANSATSSATNTAPKDNTAILIDTQNGAQSQEQFQALASRPAQGEAAAHTTDAPRENDAAHATDKNVVASDDSKKVPEKHSAKLPEEISAPANAATKSSLAISAPLSQVAPIAIVPINSAQQFVTQLPQAASATQRPIMHLKQSNAAPTSVVAFKEAADRATASTGTQIVASAAQPKTNIAPALHDMPPALAIPGNAIPTNIPAQQPATQLPPDASAPQRPITPTRQSDSAPAPVEAFKEASHQATVSSGMQTGSSAAQPETTIAQAFSYIPPAGAIPGNTIRANFATRQPSLQVPADASATQQPITPMKQTDTAPASVVAVNGAPNETTVSTGTQIAQSDAQSKRTFAQAFTYMPPAITAPGNAIPANIATQQFATQAPHDVSATQRPITPTKQSNAVPDEATVSSGTQFAQSDAQPKRTFAQAFTYMPPAITAPGNAIPANIATQQFATQAPHDVSATQRPITPTKQSNAVPDEATVSNRTQIAQSDAQSKTTSAQAFTYMPSAIAVPGNAIPTNIQAQQPAPQLPQDASATQRPITPTKPSGTAPASVAAMNDAPDEATVSNAMQTASGPSQSETAITQAFLDLLPDIAAQGNAIQTNIVGAANDATGSSQLASRATPKQSFDSSVSINPNPADKANAGANKIASTASGSHDAPFHDSQSSQNMQRDTSQSVPASPKAADNSLPQLQVQAQPQAAQIIVAAPVHQVAPPPHLPGVLTDTPRLTDQRVDPGLSHSETGAVATTPDIKSATLIQALNGTEMRVGMHSSDFGNISIRTFMSTQTMRTQISLDHGELSQVISNHVSSVQAKLGDEFGLHASIEINNQGASLSGNAEQSSQRQYGSSAGSMQAKSAANPAAVDTGISMEMPVVAGSGHQLDIRA